jgi:hypothetical protein
METALGQRPRPHVPAGEHALAALGEGSDSFALAWIEGIRREIYSHCGISRSVRSTRSRDQETACDAAAYDAHYLYSDQAKPQMAAKHTTLTPPTRLIQPVRPVRQRLAHNLPRQFLMADSG